MNQAPSKAELSIENPPTTTLGILSRLGPGLIIAGSIVGSGELIGTTITSAKAGFWLLWLIIIGCVIKVFVQVELGRDAINRGKSTMDALSEVPGPSIKGRGNWLVWYWFLMWAAMTAQLGAIAEGVGQAMAISVPLTAEGREYNTHMDQWMKAKVNLALLKHRLTVAGEDLLTHSEYQAKTREEAAFKIKSDNIATGNDVMIWTALLAIVTSVLLVVGRYRLIENVTTTLVAMFTLMTVATVVALQWTKDWAIAGQDIANGLSFRLPPGDTTTALSSALQTFGLIGVGASELVAYPYWCLEKGYARYTGKTDSSPAWAGRALGWMRVLRWDVWCSMIVYTTATLAFYLLGAAILGRSGLIPADSELIRTLNVMYEPVFGSWAKILFLGGAFAVLYSTFFVASAGNARICADALGVIGLAARDPAAVRKRVVFLSGLFPILSLLLLFLMPKQPQNLVFFSGAMQALMLPMLAVAAIFFRYRRCDPRVVPGRFWDACLWITSAGMLIISVSVVVLKAMTQFGFK